MLDSTQLVLVRMRGRPIGLRAGQRRTPIFGAESSIGCQRPKPGYGRFCCQRGSLSVASAVSNGAEYPPEQLGRRPSPSAREHDARPDRTPVWTRQPPDGPLQSADGQTPMFKQRRGDKNRSAVINRVQIRPPKKPTTLKAEAIAGAGGGEVQSKPRFFCKTVRATPGPILVGNTKSTRRALT